MAIKVLFFDTSALIKIFVEKKVIKGEVIKEEGVETIKWLTSSSVKVCHSLCFVINEQVCSEFVNKIESFASSSEISKEKAYHVISTFEKNYKNKYFRIIGQEIISNTKIEKSFDEISFELNLIEGKNDWDGKIFQSIVNALASLEGESHPILVTCDKKFASKVRDKGYRVINPITMNQDNIIEIIT